MKVIFLDIDGVLNDSDIFIKNKDMFDRKSGAYLEIDEEKVKVLSDIVVETGALIILSSAWRTFWNPNPVEPRNIKAKLLTELFNKYNIKIYDITPQLGSREKEIEYWLNMHSEVESYLVIDDEVAHVIKFCNEGRLLKTNFWNTEDIPGGLQDGHKEEAIKILNRKIK